jgi:hypothetical protein
MQRKSGAIKATEFINSDHLSIFSFRGMRNPDLIHQEQPRKFKSRTIGSDEGGEEKNDERKSPSRTRSFRPLNSAERCTRRRTDL